MQKILKIGMYLFSISSLAALVFVGGIFSKITRQDDSDGSGTGLRGLLPLLGLGVDHARADVPGGGGGGFFGGGDSGADCGPGDAGDSGAGDC